MKRGLERIKNIIQAQQKVKNCCFVNLAYSQSVVCVCIECACEATEKKENMCLIL